MRSVRFRWLFFLPLCITSTWAQQTQQATTPAPPPQRDTQALTVITQSLTALGGVNPLSAIQDFKGLGTITYYWAGKEVSGDARVRGRAPDSFRLDANLPEGTRSYAFSNLAGSLRDYTGKISQIPLHNLLNTRIPIFPHFAMKEALNDESTSISHESVVDVAGQKMNRIRIQRNLSAANDPGGTISKFLVTDYFVDAATGFVTKVSDVTHPIETLSVEYPRDYELEQYQKFSGINFPTLIREKINGQVIWELHVSSVSFNTGLVDNDFTLN
jgi:hypothetical protein